MTDITQKSNQPITTRQKQGISLGELFDAVDKAEEQLAEQKKQSEDFAELVDSMSGLTGDNNEQTVTPIQPLPLPTAAAEPVSQIPQAMSQAQPTVQPEVPAQPAVAEVTPQGTQEISQSQFVQPSVQQPAAQPVVQAPTPPADITQQ